MTGTVDGFGRALLRIRLRHPTTNAATELDAWVDTAFTGELAVPQTQLTSLNLPLGPAVRAALADGSEVDLETHRCHLDWFGAWKTVELIASDGQHPLLGIGLLVGHELHIDYRAMALTLL
jgi:clan AA aspartic protease